MTAPSSGLTKEEIEKAAKEAAVTNANDWYAPEEIRADGAFRWSVHRDGAEDGFKLGCDFALAAMPERERKAKIEALEEMLDDYGACSECEYYEAISERIANLRKGATT